MGKFQQFAGSLILSEQSFHCLLVGNGNVVRVVFIAYIYAR